MAAGDIDRKEATTASPKPVDIWDATADQPPTDFWGGLNEPVQTWDSNKGPPTYKPQKTSKPRESVSIPPEKQTQVIDIAPELPTSSAPVSISARIPVSIPAELSTSLPGTESPPQAIMDLSEPQDWHGWISYIQGVACLNGTWDYINPNGSQQLEKPARPPMPSRPALDEPVKRDKDESNIDFQAKLQVYKYKMDIIMGEYNLAQDCHRLDCLEFSIKLEEYAAAKKEMRNINDLIFKTVDKRWVAQLAGSGTMTPRDHLRKLESLLGLATSHAEDPVSQLLTTAQDKGHCDWQSWANELRKLNAQCLEIDPSASYNYDVMDAFLSTVRSEFEEFYDRWATMVGSGRNIDAGRSTISVMFEDVLGNFLKSSLQNPAYRLAPFRKRMFKETDGAPRSTVHERAPSPSPSASVRSDRPPRTHDNKNKGPSPKLCPACNQVHPIKGKNWWETCWVYLDICGKRPAPKWYDMTPGKIDRVKRRMRANPNEQRAADKFFSEQAAS